MTGTVTCSCGTPTSGNTLCDRCTRTFAICLVNVSAYYDDLETIATKRARYGTSGATKGSIGKAQPVPVDGRFLDVTGTGTQVGWDTWATVVAWCRTIMADQPNALPGPACRACIHPTCTDIRRRRWPRSTIRAMLAYFDRQFRWIIAQSFAPQMLDELLDCERRLRRLIDRPPDRWYAGKCSSTDELLGTTCETELYALVDSGTLTCEGCGAEHDVARRRDFLLAEAKDYQVTATEAAQALLAWTDYDGTETKLVDRIRKWRDRGRLEVLDVTSLSGRDRHLYRLGDIQVLLIGEAQDAQTKRLTDGRIGA